MRTGSIGSKLRIGLVVVLAAASGGAAFAQEELAARGRDIAEAACAACHAVGRTGKSSDPRAPAFRELGQRYAVDSLEETLAEGVLTGHPEMPKVKMSTADIGAFVAYLKTIQVPKP